MVSPKNQFNQQLLLDLVSSITTGDLQLISDTITWACQWAKDGIRLGEIRRRELLVVRQKIDVILMAAIAAGDLTVDDTLPLSGEVPRKPVRAEVESHKINERIERTGINK